MTDYINREDAKDAVINIVGWKKIAMYVDEMSNHPSTKDIDYYDALMDAEDAIDDLPSADVAPVRHGWWDTNEDNRIVCSECKHGAPYMYKISDKLIMQELTDYCPYCGAFMDEEVDA